VSNIAASGKHLLALINDVLDLSRVASGEIEVVIGLVAVDEVIAEAVAKVRPLADRKGLTLSVEEACDPEALADPLRLQQIVLNLLSNAIKFTPHGGVVTIRAWSAGAIVEIEVTDTGIGVAKECLELIFDEYSQLDDASNREQEGTGLGLSVSRRLAELMSATLTVESAIGRGSIFRLRLPAASVVRTEDSAGLDLGGGRGRQAEKIVAKATQP
jgi:signal transduction histidine kinase